MKTARRHRQARTRSRCLAPVALASLLVLIAILAGLAPTAGAATVNAHRDARLANQNTTKAKAKKKKKKPAPTTIKMKLLGSVAPESPENANERRGWLYTDGVRWAAYEPTAGITRLIETIKNKTIERVDPLGCVDGLIAVGGGEMLYSCESPECPEHERRCPLPANNKLASTRYVVEDIGSGEQHPVAGEDTLPNQSPEAGIGGLTQIGSQWAQGGIGTHIGGYNFFLNWHTGQLVREEQEGSEHSIENLSNPDLTQPICKPITRPKNMGEFEFVSFSPVEYEPPFAIVGPLYASDPEADVRMQLRKCGSAKSVFLPSAAEGSVQLGANILSWIGAYAYVTHLNAHVNAWHGTYYKLQGLLKVGNATTLLQHTSTMAFATIGRGEGATHIYVARLPWVR